MNETKQSPQNPENPVSRTVFWGTIALAAITLLVSGYFFNFLLHESKSQVIYIGMAVFGSGIVAMLAAIIIAIRGRQDIAVKLAFYTLLVLGAGAVGLFQGRAFTAIPTVLVISIVAVNWLFPSGSRRNYVVQIVVGIIILVALEWINPPWRIQVAAAKAGPIGAVIFVILLSGMGLSRFRNFSLRTKLLSASLLVALIPLAIVFYINNRATTRDLTASSDAAIEGVAAQTASALDTFIAERLNDVRVESQNHILLAYLALPASERAGSEIEADLNNDLFAVSRRDQTFITSVGLIDKNGISVADTEQIEIGVDKSDRNYFIGARDTQLPYASPLEISSTTGDLSLYFTAPVRDKNGNFVGVLRIRYNGAVIQSIVNSSATQANLGALSLVVLDENHIRLAHNLAPELILKSVVPLPADQVTQLQTDRRLATDKPVAELSTNIQSLEDGLNNLDTQRTFIAEFHDAGEGDEEGTAARLTSQPWLVAAGQDQDVFLAPLTAQTRTNTILALIIAGVVALVAVFVAQTIARPVVNLTTVAGQIAQGDINVRAKVESQDEIGLLASTFNQMTAQLRELIGSLEQRVADRTKALATSSEVSRSLSTILEKQQLVTEVVERVKTSFNYYHAHIFLTDEASGDLVMAGGTGEAGATMLASGHKILKGKGLVGGAAENNRYVLVSDTSANPDWLPNPLLPETKSELAVPISIGDNVLGVLDVQHNITGGLQQEDADLLQSIGNQVAVALQNIRQYESTQKIAADMGVVANVGIATSTITDATLLLQEVVDLSKKSFKLYHAHIYLLNETGDALELTSGAGEVGRQMVSEKRSIPLDSEQSLVARAARTREGVVVNDVTAAPDFLPNPLLPDTRSEMAVPMLVAGKVIGVLDVQSEIVNRFTDVDVSIQSTLASQVAVALQNARSFSQTQRQAERETAVNLITQRIQSTTSIEAALQMTARELGRALGMKQTVVSLDATASSGDGKSN